MNINNLGLLNSLCAILNEGVKDSDYAISVYLIKNINSLDNITVNRIMDETFTSRSAIRRFCNRIGYGNFGELKESITQLIYPSNLRHREFNDLESHREYLNQLIGEMIEDIDRLFTKSVIDEIIQKMDEHEDVVLLCANNTSGDLIRFQQEMIYGNKELKVVASSYTTNHTILDLSEDSLLLTVSASGKFADEANEWIRTLKGQKMLITAFRHPPFDEVYDDIYFISKNSFSNDYLGIYGKYGITYIFDLISAEYLFRAQNE